MNVTSSPNTLVASEVSVAAVVIDELTTNAAEDPEVSQHPANLHRHMQAYKFYYAYCNHYDSGELSTFYATFKAIVFKYARFKGAWVRFFTQAMHIILHISIIIILLTE